MAFKERTYTNQEFWAFTDLPENADKSFELIRGAIVEKTSPNFLHSLIVTEIEIALKLYLRRYIVGIAVDVANNFVLAEGFIFKPDVAYISLDQMTSLSQKFAFSPDIAVEVTSDQYSAYEFQRKLDAYIKYGSKQIWVVAPQDKILYVYRPLDHRSGNIRKYTATDTLDGGDVLPGFSVSAGDFFPELKA